MKSFKLKYIESVKNEIDQKELTSRQMVAIYSPYSTNKKSKDSDSDEAGEEKVEYKEDVVAVKMKTSEAVESVIKNGQIAITSINCYDACASIIRTMRQGLNSDKTGFAIVVGTSKDFSHSGLLTFFETTPNCMIVTLKAFDKDIKERDKTIKEEYVKYKELLSKRNKAITEENSKIVENAKAAGKTRKDVEDKLTATTKVKKFITPQNYVDIVTWKYILSVCDAIYMTGTSASVAVSGNLVTTMISRECLINSNRPAYFFDTEQGPIKFANAIVINEKTVADADFYDEAQNVMPLDVKIFSKVLLGQKATEKLVKTVMIPKLSQDLIEANKPKDYVEVSGADFTTTKENIVCIHTPKLPDVPINITEETPASPTVQSFLSCLYNVLENYLSKGRTILVQAGESYGASVLREAYYCIAANPEIAGNVVILSTPGLEKNEEAEKINAFIGALMGTGKAKLVKSVFLPRTVKVPNNKEDKKPDDPEFLNRTVSDKIVSDLIAEEVVSSEIFISFKDKELGGCKPTVVFDEKACDFKSFKYDEEIEAFTNEKTFMSKTAWYKEVPDLYDLTEVKNAIYGTVAETSAKNVKGFGK